ncbi:4-(cytidine 5'-diphospho)-2-C-methyl-D-erythritol kinase [Acinetobacter nectaris]|uniref:4-(cytidine 5'-diphospho)-2-C-methyl-D-erythritol kinase n=1 Tax=Acinetobacter nectaris TaxID=1219382 RepID=UPI001F011C31|nr:4-(cytidine 5'-diphospho)-2-C-methyl-D-erythritol kinase [Acinetobacter nectaris]MCF8998795.1 4-(cytidine 5'-diphospho)-2-C-methyl-D-erythritol kinase [Acinetobacter nectaris]MCF9027964.1 4-(cytidine 5'-diphospho)-2-C-methyl-D-erythritol kinase [Acinetobacter nectaris]
MIKVASPAKINLFLHITGRRQDGYHELQTIFQFIDLYDWLSFSQTDSDQITIEGIPSVDNTDNLIYKAAQLLKPYAKKNHGLHIKIEKNIPMGAGLGGGSSNAATTLITLNRLWQCGLSQTELAHLAIQLGADVPIFIYGKNAWAEGVGEQISPVNLPKKCYIILKPDCFISTQKLFSQKTLTRDSKPSKFCAYQQQPSNFGNCFEHLAKKLYPQVDEAMQYLNQFGNAKLTGTGACVFVETTESMNVEHILKHSPCNAYLVNSLEESPLIHI